MCRGRRRPFFPLLLGNSFPEGLYGGWEWLKGRRDPSWLRSAGHSQKQVFGWLRQGPRAHTVQIAVVFDIADDSAPCKGQILLATSLVRASSILTLGLFFCTGFLSPSAGKVQHDTY